MECDQAQPTGQSRKDADQQPGQGRGKHDRPEDGHRCRQWQGNPLAWRVSCAALCTASRCEKPAMPTTSVPNSMAATAWTTALALRLSAPAGAVADTGGMTVMCLSPTVAATIAVPRSRIQRLPAMILRIDRISGEPVEDTPQGELAPVRGRWTNFRHSRSASAVSMS